MSYIFPIAIFVIVVAVLAIASFTNFELDNDHYDRLKWVVLKWSYLVTFVALIVKTLNVAYGFETVTILAGFGAMLAGLMDISKSNWDGEELGEDEYDTSEEEDEDEDYEDELEEGDE